MEANMSDPSEILTAKHAGTDAARQPATSPWRVRKVQAASPPRPLLRRLFGRPEPTTFQRCLAVHLHYTTNPRGGLS
jgi:hypothetical protein